jgi:hypothetical protein
MKLKLLVICLFVSGLSFSQQRTCGTDHYMQTLMADPVARAQYAQYEAQFNIELEKLVNQQIQRNNTGGNVVNSTIRIPVAVHFPSASATLIESGKQCLRNLAQTQINILNADFNATNADIALWNDARVFYPGVNVGNMNVQFVIATQNHPAGTGLTNGTPAITFGTDFLSNADTDTTWSGYMNLVVRNISGGILGYSPLGGQPSSGMTVVIDNNAFGSGGGCSFFVPNTSYNLGRTLTHELGHFFNLSHTFASCDGADCATSGDRVCDTPSINRPEYECLADGSVGSACAGAVLPQLTMNYMDYVQDACMYMFTAGQATRMTAWYNSISAEFLTNTLGNNDFVENNFSIYPNPNNGTFNIVLKELASNYTIQIYDATGRTIVDYEYSNDTSLSQEIKIDNALTGLYFVTIKVADGGIINKKVIVQ